MIKEQQELLDKAYENYRDNFLGYDDIPIKEVFVLECKTNSKFSEKWGLKIDERELSLGERSFFAGSNHDEVTQNIKAFTGVNEDHTLHKQLDDINTPTKIISITYNNETLESYGF